MTCIAATVDGDVVLIAADSGSFNMQGNEQLILRNSKTFRRCGIAFGVAGCFRVAQVLQYQLIMPAFVPGTDPFEWMVVTFVEALRGALDDCGVLHRANDVDSMEAIMIVGLAGRIFVVASDLHVAEAAEGYAAIGAGESVALGALHACTQNPALYPDETLQIALDAASLYTSLSAGPTTMVYSTWSDFEQFVADSERETNPTAASSHTAPSTPTPAIVLPTPTRRKASPALAQADRRTIGKKRTSAPATASDAWY